MPEKPPTDRHLWEFIWVRDLAFLTVVSLLLWTLYLARAIAAPVLIGLGLAYVFNPLITLLNRRWRMPRWALSGGVILFFVLAALCLFIWIGPPAVKQSRQLVGDIGSYAQYVNDRANVDWKHLGESFRVRLGFDGDGDGASNGDGSDSGAGDSDDSGASSPGDASGGSEKGDATTANNTGLPQITFEIHTGNGDESADADTDAVSSDAVAAVTAGDVDADAELEGEVDAWGDAERHADGDAAADFSGDSVDDAAEGAAQSNPQGDKPAAANESQPVGDAVKSLSADQVTAALGQLGAVLASLLNLGAGAAVAAAGWTSYIALAGVVSLFCFFFFAWKFDPIIKWFLPLIPKSERENSLAIVCEMDRTVAAFIRGRLIQALSMSFILAIGWGLVGVPYWLLLALICGFLNLIPYAAAMGWVAAVVIAVLDRMTDGAGFSIWAIVLPSLVYFAAQFIDGWVIEPIVQGAATDMDPLTVFLVVLFGGALAGLLGMLLAIPIAACSKIIAREVILPRLRKYAEEH